MKWNVWHNIVPSRKPCLAWKIYAMLFSSVLWFTKYRFWWSAWSNLNISHISKQWDTNTQQSMSILEYTSNLNTELHLYFCHFFCGELQNEDTSDTKGWDNMGQGLSKKCTLKWVHQLQRPLPIRGLLATGPCKQQASACETIAPACRWSMELERLETFTKQWVGIMAVWMREQNKREG